MRDNKEGGATWWTLRIFSKCFLCEILERNLWPEKSKAQLPSLQKFLSPYSTTVKAQQFGSATFDPVKCCASTQQTLAQLLLRFIPSTPHHSESMYGATIDSLSLSNLEAQIQLLSLFLSKTHTVEYSEGAMFDQKSQSASFDLQWLLSSLY